MFIISLVLLFILKLRFPSNRPIAGTIRNKYGPQALQSFRRVENVWRKRDKTMCDIDFLKICYNSNTIPKFLRIKVYKKHLQRTTHVNTLQRKLLEDELSCKGKHLEALERQLSDTLAQLQSHIGKVDFSALKLWLVRKQKRVVNKIKQIHEKKLRKLQLSPLSAGLSVDKVIFNYSNRILTASESKILLLGLDFGLPLRKLNFNKYYLIFEKLFLQLQNFNIYNYMPNSEQTFKSLLKTVCHKYFHSFQPFKSFHSIFTNSDFRTLKKLSQDKSIYVTKPDKGCGVVILNRGDYEQKVYSVINDPDKFEEIHLDEKKLLIKLEDKLNNTLRSLKTKGNITESFYNECFTSGSQLGKLYGLPKVHKSNCLVCPIVAAYGSFNFNLGKHIVPLISHLADNQYSLKNSYDFADTLRILNDANNSFMCSLDISSLYTNIPVAETIDLILNKLYVNNTATYNGIRRDNFRKLLELSLSDTYFKFNGKIYKQKEGLSMGASPSPIVANIFLNHFETHCLAECPINFKPQFYRRYLDDTFLIFRNEDQAKQFFNFINNRHNNITFTFEGSTENSIAFLDVKVTRKNDLFSTSIYRKPTFTGQGIIFFSNIYHKYKSAALFTLINRAFKLSSSYELFHNELTFLKHYFQNNGFSISYFNSTVKKFLNQQYHNKPLISTVLKQIVYVQLPFIGMSEGVCLLKNEPIVKLWRK